MFLSRRICADSLRPLPTIGPVNFQSAFRDAVFRYARKARAAHRRRFYLKHGLANHRDAEREIRAAPFVAWRIRYQVRFLLMKDAGKHRPLILQLSHTNAGQIESPDKEND